MSVNVTVQKMFCKKKRKKKRPKKEKRALESSWMVVVDIGKRERGEEREIS